MLFWNHTTLCHWVRFRGAVLWLLSDAAAFVHSEDWFLEVFYLVVLGIFGYLEALGMMHWENSGMLFADTDIGLECALFWYLFCGNFLFFRTDVIFTQFIQILVSRLTCLILSMTTRLFSLLIPISLHRLIFQSFLLFLSLLSFNFDF